MSFPFEGKRIYVAGDRGMVGSALVRRLADEPCDIVLAPRALDLRDQAATQQWFSEERPDAVFLAAARVGGILANSERPGEFLYDNLMIAANVIEAARRCAVGKLMFLGSSCIYPKHAPQPIPEEALLTGPARIVKAARGKPLTILGIACTTLANHAAALIVDGQLIASVQEERLRRRKQLGWHPPGRPGETVVSRPRIPIQWTHPRRSIQSVLQSAGVGWDDVDVIAGVLPGGEHRAIR